MMKENKMSLWMLQFSMKFSSEDKKMGKQSKTTTIFRRKSVALSLIQFLKLK